SRAASPAAAARGPASPRAQRRGWRKTDGRAPGLCARPAATGTGAIPYPPARVCAARTAPPAHPPGDRRAAATRPAYTPDKAGSASGPGRAAASAYVLPRHRGRWSRSSAARAGVGRRPPLPTVGGRSCRLLGERITKTGEQILNVAPGGVRRAVAEQAGVGVNVVGVIAVHATR